MDNSLSNRHSKKLNVGCTNQFQESSQQLSLNQHVNLQGQQSLSYIASPTWIKKQKHQNLSPIKSPEPPKLNLLQLEQSSQIACQQKLSLGDSDNNKSLQQANSKSTSVCITSSSQLNPKTYQISNSDSNTNFPCSISSQNSQDYITRYIKSLQALEDQSQAINCLQNHQITVPMRQRMVDWILEVSQKFKFCDSTFFISVSIMDRFFANVDQCMMPGELHEIGVCSMFIASKYEEVFPLRLQQAVDIVAGGKFTSEYLKEVEIGIMETIRFELGVPQIYNYVMACIISLKQTDLLGILGEKWQDFEDLCISFARMITYEYEFHNNYNMREQAAACIYVAFKYAKQFMVNENSQISNIQTLQSIVPYVDQIREILESSNAQIIQASNTLIVLAQNFRKKYPKILNLHQLEINCINKMLGKY